MNKSLPLDILHQESWWLRKMTKKFLAVSEDKWVLRTFLAKCNLRITTLSFYWTFFFFFSGENSRSTSWRASKVDSISRARRKTQGLCQVGAAIKEFRVFRAILFLDVEQINFTWIYLPFKQQICTNLLSWLDLNLNKNLDFSYFETGWKWRTYSKIAVAW